MLPSLNKFMQMLSHFKSAYIAPFMSKLTRDHIRCLHHFYTIRAEPPASHRSGSCRSLTSMLLFSVNGSQIYEQKTKGIEHAF